MRANEDNASDAAPNRLPRLREGGLDGCDDGTEDNIGDIGGVGRSVSEVGEEAVVTIDCAVRGRLVFLWVKVVFVDKGPRGEAGGDEMTGEYVTNDEVAAADGCAANGSATNMR